MIILERNLNTNIITSGVLTPCVAKQQLLHNIIVLERNLDLHSQIGGGLLHWYELVHSLSAEPISLIEV